MMSWDFSQFHFIRPAYLLAAPVVFMLWYFLGRVMNSSRWESYISKDLIEALKVEGGKSLRSWRWVLLTAWLLACFAVAGPSWTKIPVPTVQNQKALVIMLDLSRSMLAKDLNPNRLTLAKFKLIDILRRQVDGQTALIAYAGDAHTVSPLSDDPKNIEALLPALHPNIMPSQGSNIEAAVELAEKLLSDAQVSAGDLLIITDGITADAQKYLKKNMNSSNRLSILGVGGDDGAPIPAAGGGFLRGVNDEIILATLNQNELQQLSDDLRGNYAQIQTDESDIDHLLFDDFELINSDEQNDNQGANATYDSWADMGHWFVILLLPFAAFCFRKGLVYVFPIIVPAMFLFPSESRAEFTWNDLWQTSDQQAANLMSQEKYSDAAQTFKRDDWAAIANYKNSDFKSASSRLENSDHIDDMYNYGNALAFNGDLEAAIEAYEKVLEHNPDQEDAAHNKEVVEKLLEQQENEQDQQDEKQDQDGEESEENEGEGEKQESDQQSSESKESQEGDQQDQQDPEQQQESDDESEKEEEEKKEKGESESEEGEASDEEQQQKLMEQLSTEQTPDELKPSSEQWLRAISDDPSGLLRRKFQYQAQQRLNNGKSRKQKQLESQNERY